MVFGGAGGRPVALVWGLAQRPHSTTPVSDVKPGGGWGGELPPE